MKRACRHCFKILWKIWFFLKTNNKTFLLDSMYIWTLHFVQIPWFHKMFYPPTTLFIHDDDHLSSREPTWASFCPSMYGMLLQLIAHSMACKHFSVLCHLLNLVAKDNILSFFVILKWPKDKARSYNICGAWHDWKEFSHVYLSEQIVFLLVRSFSMK